MKSATPEFSNNKLDVFFMDIADKMATRSHCARMKVGAVLVRDGRIISTGWNGTPSGFENCDDHFREQDTKTKEFKDIHSSFSIFEAHAEANCIAAAARHGIRTERTEIYTSYAPCMSCAKIIVQAGITRVVFKEKYDRPEEDSLWFLINCKVQCVQLLS